MPLTSRTASETTRFEPVARATDVLMILTKVYFHPARRLQHIRPSRRSRLCLRAFFIEQNSNVQSKTVYLERKKNSKRTSQTLRCRTLYPPTVVSRKLTRARTKKKVEKLFRMRYFVWTCDNVHNMAKPPRDCSSTRTKRRAGEKRSVRARQSIHWACDGKGTKIRTVCKPPAAARLI